jgi:thioredoxin 1
MSKPIEVTDETFEKEVIQSDIPVVVDFWAIWCGPCRTVAPILEQIAEEYSGRIKVAKLDVDHNPNIAVKYGIRSIPTILFFKNGNFSDQIIGAYPKSNFVEKVEALL